VIDSNIIGKAMSKYLKYFLSARNGLFVGVPLMGVGILIASPKMCDKKKMWIYWILFFASLATFVCEVLFTYGKNVQDDDSLFISFIVLIPTMVLLAQNYNLTLKLPYKHLRQMSVCIFFSHPFYSSVLSYGIDKGWLRFVLTLALSLLTYFIMFKFDVKIMKKVM
jgi:uncharacterized membrane protein